MNVEKAYLFTHIKVTAPIRCNPFDLLQKIVVEISLREKLRERKAQTFSFPTFSHRKIIAACTTCLCTDACFFIYATFSSNFVFIQSSHLSYLLFLSLFCRVLWYSVESCYDQGWKMWLGISSCWNFQNSSSALQKVLNIVV